MTMIMRLLRIVMEDGKREKRIYRNARGVRERQQFHAKSRCQHPEKEKERKGSLRWKAGRRGLVSFIVLVREQGSRL